MTPPPPPPPPPATPKTKLRGTPEVKGAKQVTSGAAQLQASSAPLAGPQNFWGSDDRRGSEVLFCHPLC